MQSKKSSSSAARQVSLVLSAPADKASKTQGRRKQQRRNGAAVAPVAYGLRTSTGRPNITPSPGADGRIRVRHREFVLDVTGSTNFNVASLSINPAQGSTFPWLSALAMGFESYRFNALRFDYCPSVGTSTAGVVNLAIDYDVVDPVPTDKVQLMQMHGAVRSSAWDSCSLVCDKPDLLKLPQRYTRKAAWAGNGDQKTYDVGTLFVATSGFGAITPCGELYVTYDIELITPQAVIFAPEAYSLRVSTQIGTAAKPFGPDSVVSEGVRYDGGLGELVFNRLGRYLVSAISEVGLPLDGVHYAATSTNATVSSGGTATNPGGYLEDLYEVVVHHIPATFKPQLVGAAAVSNGFLRSAPFVG